MSQNVNGPSTGTFEAYLNGVKFLASDLVKFHKSNNGDIIQGYEKNINFVVFSVPETLVGGPHKVFHDPNDLLVWAVQIQSQIFAVKSGYVIVTFDKDRASVTGTVNLVLPGNIGTVTGDFNITNRVV